MIERLGRLRADGKLTDLDLHFATFMSRLSGCVDAPFLLAAALACHRNGEGHVCLPLSDVAGMRPFEDEDDIVAPALKQWVKDLRKSSAVGEPGDLTPLILDAAGRLYLYRYWQYEKELADAILLRSKQPAEGVDPARLRKTLDRLFPGPASAEPDLQKVAAATAAMRNFCVISGGPGTGKTTVVTRILALLIEQFPGRELRVALAAPTGKAAARMQEAVRAEKARLDIEDSVRKAIPDQASTIHRLLGAVPGSTKFRYNRDNPLPVDVLVVDEASMVDVALMAKVFAGVPETARVILLGDKDQLASVEAGAVLGDICSGESGFSESFAASLGKATGERVSGGGRTGLRDSIVLLRRNYRFGNDSGIGALASAINDADQTACREILRSGSHPEIKWRVSPDNKQTRAGVAQWAEAGFGEYLRLIAGGAGADAILAAFGRHRVLSPHRTGPTGVESLNALIEEHMRHRKLVTTRQSWYPGRPVMVTTNDYAVKLYNGDIGIAIPDPEDRSRLRVTFQAPDGTLRPLPPARLPEHETAYASTVHKSQGSEFGQVLLVLPETATRVTTRELLYTAVTRARTSVEIWGSEAVFLEGVSKRLERSSGLRESLWECPVL